MKLDQLKLGGRLGGAFACVLVLTLGMAAMGVGQLVSITGLSERSDTHAGLMQTAEQWRGATALNLARTMAIAKSGAQPDLVAYLQPQMKDTSAEISTLQKRMEAGLSAEAASLMSEIGAKRKRYIETRDAVLALLKVQDPSGAAAVDGRLAPAAQDYVQSVNGLAKLLEAQGDVLTAEIAERSRSAQWILGVLAVAALAIGTLLAWTITRSITRRLRGAVEAMRAITGGDLSRPIDAKGGDEIADLLRGLAEMQSSLGRIIGSVRQGTDSITTASTEIASGNQDLSTRTEHAASNLQQTASAMEQLTGTVKQTAESARTANQLASSAQTTAAKGGQVVAQVVTTMDEINASSKKIADIIGVIDGIAFQTNILALNAAVEAARAGEQGRGFAVVAGEVRSLAQRSANAAKEIKSLIGASVEKVESGGHLVADAGRTMNEIVASVQRVSDIINEITAAAAEQSDGIGQVNHSVTQLDQMTQQNAALVEQSAAAAESLKDQASQLAASVLVFKIGAARAGASA
jgi:methyl-accepting chemotaxis protein